MPGWPGLTKHEHSWATKRNDPGALGARMEVRALTGDHEVLSCHEESCNWPPPRGGSRRNECAIRSLNPNDPPLEKSNNHQLKNTLALARLMERWECLELGQRWFKLDIRKDFSERGVRHCNRLPREVVDASSQGQAGWALDVAVCNHCKDVRLDDF